MFVEGGQLTEASVTVGAPVRPLASVRAQVHSQVPFLHEAAAAVRAAEWLLTCVATDVPHQRCPPAEALVADGAGVRPLAGVDPHMSPQVPTQRETLAALTAAERRLPVNLEVKLQGLCGLQMFPTQAAVFQMC